MQVDVIVTWVLLAIVAGVLYTAPKYILSKAKEGFDALSGQQLVEMQKMLVSPVYTDSSRGVSHYAADRPDGSTESIPADLRMQSEPSFSDQQGALLNERHERRSCPQPTVIYKTQTQYVPVPDKECPDLRDFIRKDQIPCWNCNLSS